MQNIINVMIWRDGRGMCAWVEGYVGILSRGHDGRTRRMRQMIQRRVPPKHIGDLHAARSQARSATHTPSSGAESTARAGATNTRSARTGATRHQSARGGGTTARVGATTACTARTRATTARSAHAGAATTQTTITQTTRQNRGVRNMFSTGSRAARGRLRSLTACSDLSGCARSMVGTR